MPRIQRYTTRQHWTRRRPFALVFLSLLLLFASQSCRAEEDDLDNDVIVVDGFVDTTTCYQHLVEADNNADGKLQASEFVEFSALQAPRGTLGGIDRYQELPLVMQATFVTLTCLCRDERFGGDPRDENCCLGVDANIAIVGNDQSSTSQQRTRLFATCFLTDQAIVQVLGSDEPSAAPTKPPTDAPTLSPTTLSPSDSPSVAPSAIPTVSPSSSPTNNPSAVPSIIPTATPSTSPSVAPVVGPTVAPVPEPTAMPSTIPSVGPTIAPVPEPTALPSASRPSIATATPTITPAPTQFFTADATVIYTIAVINGDGDEGIPRSAYRNDLISAMNQLATVVVPQHFGVGSLRRRLLRRRLEVVLQLPTDIGGFDVTECMEGLNTTENDRCENVEAIITLGDNEELDAAALADFEVAMLDAIARGDLQFLLPADSPVRILTGLSPSDPPAPITRDGVVDDEGLSGGATAGIVVAALIVALVPIALYVGMRRSHEAKEPYGAYEPHDAGSVDGIRGPEEVDVEATTPVKSPTLGAKPSSYGKVKTAAQTEKVRKVTPVSPDSREGDGDDDHHSHASSSNAGSSGWSSSAGLSSLNTGSADDSMDAMLRSPRGSSLAAIAAASASTRQTERAANLSPRSGGEAIDIPAGAVSRSDLDNAIEAGDWAAVGATAALLAAGSDSQSQSSKSRASASRSQNTSGSSIDAARAAELDHLVDAGDWEGVVLAAAKFEAQEGGSGSIRSGTASSARSSSAGSETETGTGSGTYTPSVSTSVSESASKAQKRQEIRQEVEALVRRVVPEEIDNVDEMMLQFKGREEELVETLRTMQERAVAQKARTAGHKAAKQEARRTVQRGHVPGASPAEAASETAAKDGQSSAGGTSDGTDESAQKKRTALEQAIEAGDWEAVGEAAALMSDTSMDAGSTSTAELERLTSGIGAATGSATSPRHGGVNAKRAQALDELIDRGDWNAVVEAAGRFSEADKQASDTSSADSPAKRALLYGGTGSAGSGDSTSKRAKQLREEEDALAQAEIWMQIAAQSKGEGGTDAGASDATDWAISRSLKDLAKAEGRGDKDDSGGNHGSHQKEGDDDESV